MSPSIITTCLRETSTNKWTLLKGSWTKLLKSRVKIMIGGSVWTITRDKAWTFRKFFRMLISKKDGSIEEASPLHPASKACFGKWSMIFNVWMKELCRFLKIATLITLEVTSVATVAEVTKEWYSLWMVAHYSMLSRNKELMFASLTVIDDFIWARF